MAKQLYMVIQKPEMIVTQLGPLDVICSKQFLENPEAIIDTSPVGSGASYSCYSKEELELLATNESLNVTGLSYGDMIVAIRSALIAKYKSNPPLESEEYYEARIAKKIKQNPEYYAQFQPEEPVSSGRFKSSQPNRANTPKSAPSTRPAGGTTKRVWEIADKIREENPAMSAKELRPKIIATCESEGINGSTAGTQFAKWKNSQNWG